MSLTVNYIDGDYAMQGQRLQTSFISQDSAGGNFLGTEGGNSLLKHCTIDCESIHYLLWMNEIK